MDSYDQLDKSIYLDLAVAFIRGRFASRETPELPEFLARARFSELTLSQKAAIYRVGQECGLRLHKFKRTMGLARVFRVLGALRSMMPNKLLDVGSGRGAFLWPLLDTFPELSVTAIDGHAQRANDLKAVSLGGVSRLEARQMDATQLKFPENQFDVVTILEVLEHIRDFRKAVAEVTRTARRYVIASVPSKPDNNPEHIHLLTRERLDEAFRDAGCRQVKFDWILNHLIVFATVAD